jgi:hypothetical protein
VPVERNGHQPVGQTVLICGFLNHAGSLPKAISQPIARQQVAAMVFSVWALWSKAKNGILTPSLKIHQNQRRKPIP